MALADPISIRSELSDDPEMRELIAMFVGVLPERIEAIEEAFQGKDLQSLIQLAHQMKGAGGGYGFSVISETAAVLEAAARGATDTMQVTGQVEALISVCRRASV